jgi:hypothetical protein
MRRGGLPRESAPLVTRIVVSGKAATFIAERGGHVWVWLDPRRSLIGSYVWLEAHCAPPGATRRTRFTRSSRRPHRFSTIQGEGVTVHADWGALDPPEEVHFDIKGWRKRTRRLEAYWNGCVFAGDDVPVAGG